MEVSLTSPAEPGLRIESPSRLFRVSRRPNIPPPDSARLLRDPEGGLRHSTCVPSGGTRRPRDWRLEAASGTQGDVRKYASVCNFYPPSGGCTSYKSMYINILGLILFWS